MHGGCPNFVKFPEKHPFSFRITYKTESFSRLRFWQAQLLNFAGRFQKDISVVVVPGKLQHIPASMFGEFSRQHQKVIANGVDRGSRVVLGQTQPLEPMDQIVGQEQQLQKGHVGHPLLGGNFVEREKVEQLPDGPFHIGSRLVSLPDHPRLRVEIGHESRIGVAAHLEQRQLLSLLRVLRQWTSHHNEPVLLFPALRLKMKFRHRPAKRNFPKASSLGQRQVALGLAADNNVAKAGFIQVSDQLSRKKSRIGQNPDPRPSHVRRDLFQAAPDQCASAGVRSRIAGAQRPVPKLLAVSLQTQKWMIRGAPLLLGVVTQPGPLLFSIQGQDDRVEVEDQARTRIGQREQLRPELIMQARDLSDGCGRESAQKTAQGSLVWKLLQSDQREKQAIVLKDLGFAHARESRDENKEKHQNHIGRVVIGPVGSVSKNALQSAAQTQFVTKALDQEQTPEVGEGVRLERKIQCLQAFSHRASYKKQAFGAAPITVRNGRLLARGQNVRFCRENKPFEEIGGLVRASFRFN